MFSKSNIFESYESSYEYSNFFPQNNCIENDFDCKSREMNNFENFNLYPKNFLENTQNADNDENQNDIFSFKPSEKQDDNFNAFNFQAPSIIDTPQKYVNENTSTKLENAKTTVLTKKRKRTTDEDEENGKKDEKKKNCGRKSKESNEKGNHDKFSEDNIMRKIKSNLLNYGHKNLNDSFINKKTQFLKLNSEINENLKKDYNEKLMATTLKELYETSPISTKYRRQKKDNSDFNRKLIEQIYNENKEYDVITKLNNTYLDLLNEFKICNLNKFLNEIREEEIKKMPQEKVDAYIEKIKTLVSNYEIWFLNKNGRNRKKNNQ